MSLFFDEYPRQTLIPDPKTMVIDRLLPGIDELLARSWRYFTVAKIGWGLPLLIENQQLRDRVKVYRDKGIDVSNGGTLLELASSKNKVGIVLDHLLQSGFSTIEMSEGVIDISKKEKKTIAEFARQNSMKLHIEVGRKNVGNQLSLEETIDRVNSALDFDPDVVIIEGRETGKSVEIYDSEGHIKWDWVSRIMETFDSSKIMFEAPLEEQQAQLITRIGPSVNLGNISLHSVLPLQSQRMGFRGDTFGGHVSPEIITGSPAAKFVYHIIASHMSIDQGQISRISGLSRRTVQIAIDSLTSQEVIKVANDPRDMRHHIYSVERIS
ncbi:Phosphosulfolactate synthase [Thermoplasmatales archaeon]|nr:Phosphosulfolactate synthase [Thermoplasmatales archaeon]